MRLAMDFPAWREVVVRAGDWGANAEAEATAAAVTIMVVAFIVADKSLEECVRILLIVPACSCFLQRNTRRPVSKGAML